MSDNLTFTSSWSTITPPAGAGGRAGASAGCQRETRRFPMICTEKRGLPACEILTLPVLFHAGTRQSVGTTVSTVSTVSPARDWESVWARARQAWPARAPAGHHTQGSPGERRGTWASLEGGGNPLPRRAAPRMHSRPRWASGCAELLSQGFAGSWTGLNRPLRDSLCRADV